MVIKEYSYSLSSRTRDAVYCHTQDTSSLHPIGETLTGTTTPGQSRPGSNGSEGAFHIPQKNWILAIK